MRGRLLRAFVAVIVLGFAVLGVPLGIIASHLVRAQAVRSLDREADAVGFAVSAHADEASPVPVATVRSTVRPDRYVVVRDAEGRTTRVGTRPDGRTVEAHVVTADGVHITILASAEAADRQALLAWLVVAALAAVGVAVAVGLAVREANRLGRPLDELATASLRLGAGDFSAQIAPSGIPEIDALGDALRSSGQRIAALVQREREFSSNASHQLRTPLTALRVRLEEAAMGDPEEMGPALHDAFAEVDRLDATITELLALARSRATERPGLVPTAQVVDQVEQRWRPILARAQRPLRTSVDGEIAAALVPGQPIIEVLNVLIDNAVHHGEGAVHVDARASSEHLVVRVSDDGPGIPPGEEHRVFHRHVSGSDGTGVGLALARTLAHSVDGRLELAKADGATFELYVPLHPPNFVRDRPRSGTNAYEVGAG